jgi:hypothetical protein
MDAPALCTCRPARILFSNPVAPSASLTPSDLHHGTTATNRRRPLMRERWTRRRFPPALQASWRPRSSRSHHWFSTTADLRVLGSQRPATVPLHCTHNATRVASIFRAIHGPSASPAALWNPAGQGQPRALPGIRPLGQGGRTIRPPPPRSGLVQRYSSPARRARGAMDFRKPTCPPGRVQRLVRPLRPVPRAGEPPAGATPRRSPTCPC